LAFCARDSSAVTEQFEVVVNMITRTKLATMKEKELQRDVLVPLFEAWGFHDVEVHQGTTEAGKDLVMCNSQKQAGKVDGFVDRHQIAVVFAVGPNSAGAKFPVLLCSAPALMLAAFLPIVETNMYHFLTRAILIVSHAML
jgi:hypothetical protein